MADVKITSLAVLTAADPINDAIPIVDVSDNSMAASGTTKRISINNILACSPSATLASATITGDLTVDTSTLKVDSANNRVGIGIATPSNQLHVKATGSTPALIETSGGALAYLQFTSTTGSAYIGNNANGLGFYTTGSADLRMSLAAAGDLSITSGNVVMGTSGKGIDFTAAGNVAGMTSELLNDYEEGTFTPAIAFGGASVGVAYAQVIGIYTKVGRLVHFSGRVDLSNKGSSTGSATITGLPFNANLGAASVGYQLSAAPSGAQVMLTISSTILTIRYATGTTTAESTDANFANNSIIIFGGTYAV